MRFSKISLLLVLLPSFTVAGKPAALSSGIVKLCKNDDWDKCSTIDFESEAKEIIKTAPYKNEQSSLYYNLPKGQVVTLFDACPDNFSEMYKERALDLVGTGTTVYLNNDYLGKRNVKNAISCYTCYTYDDSEGYVTFYNDQDYKGNTKTVFLSLFNPDELVDIRNWHINNHPESVKWNIPEVVQFEIYEDQGSGKQDAFTGWSSMKEKSSLPGMNNKVSSFRITFKRPEKEEIKDVTFDAGSMSVGNSFSQFYETSNDAGTEARHTLTINQETARTVSTTVTEGMVHGWSIEVTATYSPPDATGGFGGSVSVGAHGSYSSEWSSTRTQTELLGLEVSQEVTVPAYCNYKARFSAEIGTIGATTVTTTADRWYSIPVANSVRDSSNNNWYKRTETVGYTVEGGIGFRTMLEVDESSTRGHNTCGLPDQNEGVKTYLRA